MTAPGFQFAVPSFTCPSCLTTPYPGPQLSPPVNLLIAESSPVPILDFSPAPVIGCLLAIHYPPCWNSALVALQTNTKCLSQCSLYYGCHYALESGWMRIDIDPSPSSAGCRMPLCAPTCIVHVLLTDQSQNLHLIMQCCRPAEIGGPSEIQLPLAATLPLSQSHSILPSFFGALLQAALPPAPSPSSRLDPIDPKFMVAESWGWFEELCKHQNAKHASRESISNIKMTMNVVFS